MDELKPYPMMKDSGLLWLGGTPEHWRVVRNGRLFTQRNESGYPELPILEVSLKTGVRVRDFEGSSRKQVMSDREKYKRARKGDVVYNTMRMWQGAVDVVPVDGLVSPAYVVARPFAGTVARYFTYLYRTDAYMGEIDACSRGIVKDRNRLYWEAFKQIPALYPPSAEQVAIVRFLDHMDRRIRRYIRAKQKVIKLLEEQKQAIIHRAVTRGLGRTIQLKASNVEWLCEIPEHWNEALLGRCLASIEQGWSPVAAEGEIAPDQWAVLSLSAVRRGTFDPGAIKPVPLSQEVPSRLQVRNGDLLLTRSNTRERVGDVCVVESVRDNTILCDLIYRLRPDPGYFNPRFLMYQLLSPVGRRQIEAEARGSSGTMPKIRQRSIRSWRVLAPPVQEQRAIVEALEVKRRAIDRAIDTARQEIALLREYRTRLIADVVTGKLDVREAAARLPAEPEEAAPFDEADDLTEPEEESEDDLEAVLEEAEA